MLENRQHQFQTIAQTRVAKERNRVLLLQLEHQTQLPAKVPQSRTPWIRLGQRMHASLSTHELRYSRRPPHVVIPGRTTLLAYGPRLLSDADPKSVRWPVFGDRGVREPGKGGPEVMRFLGLKRLNLVSSAVISIHECHVEVCGFRTSRRS